MENRLGYSENFLSSSLSPSFHPRGNLEPATSDPAGSTSLAIPRLFSSYAESRSADSAFDGTSILAGSTKLKKTGAETREELLSSLLSRSYTSRVRSNREFFPRPVSLRGTLVETLDSFQKSIPGDMMNLHIQVLRQYHMNQMDMSRAISLLLDNQAELKRELQQLRKENKQIRRLISPRTPSRS